MVTVPLYQQTTELRPEFRQGVDVQASPDAFGAAIGRGMVGFAQGVSQVGQAMQQVRELEDIARAKEADNKFAGWLRERQYGENGFLTLDGKAAVDARKSFEDDVAKARGEFGKGLPAGALKAYQTASDARMQSTLEQSIKHTADARKTWFKDASTARIETFANDALVAFNDPTKVNKNIAAGILELREQGKLAGWDADSLKMREMEFASGVHKNIALRMAQNDPLAANDYVKKNEKFLTGKDQYDLTSTLKDAVQDEQSKREAEKILSTTRVSQLPGDIVGEVAAAGPRGGGGPTQSKAFLASRSAHPDRPGDTLNLEDGFADNLAAFIQDAPPEIRKGLGIGSGYRSNEVQKRLFAESDGSGRNVAFPAGYEKPDGTIAKGSNHLHGRAVDLSYNGMRLDKAPPEVVQWVHENAGKYGLRFPMGWEPWHVEPQKSGTITAQAPGATARARMPSYDQIEAQLGQITDPRVRDLTRKRLYSMMEAQSKADEANQKAAKAELWSYVDQGKTPDQVPLETRRAAGMEAVSSAWTYIEKQASRNETKSDEALLYDMRKYAAMKPDDFAKIDLNDYRDRLSKDAIKELTGLQTSALSDQRKAREDGITITSAFSQAETQLKAVGIAKDPSDMKEADKQRLAMFQNQLASEMQKFAELNNNRQPTQMEIQSMINRMLLPVVIKQPGTLWGTNNVDPFGTSDGKTFLFETGGRTGPLGKDMTVELNIEYKNIPINDRVDIELTLERVLGRKPSPTEVETAYEQYMLERR